MPGVQCDFGTRYERVGLTTKYLWTGAYDPSVKTWAGNNISNFFLIMIKDESERKRNSSFNESLPAKTFFSCANYLGGDEEAQWEPAWYLKIQAP